MSHIPKHEAQRRAKAVGQAHTEGMTHWHNMRGAERTRCCPTCNAPEGEPCLTKSGNYTDPHITRMYAFYDTALAE